MSLLRILRNLAVLAILAVGGLALTPRPAAAAVCACYPRVPLCSSHTTGCRFCGGSTRCCFTVCYDTLYRRCCVRPT
jgi:hypothetical protein